MKNHVFFRFAAALVVVSLFSPAVRAAFHPEDLDPSVKPQDDFFRYANGGWLAAHPIPPGHSRWGSYDALEVETRARLRRLCETAAAKGDAGTPLERLVGDYFASGMDLAAIDAAGLSPVQPELDRIAAIETPDDVLRSIAHFHALGLPVAFAFQALPDPTDNRVYLAQLRPAGLGLPDRDYYVKTDARAQALRAAYETHVAALLALAGTDPAAAKTDARAVVDLETTLAVSMLPRETLRDPRASYHRTAWADLPPLSNRIGWDDYLTALAAPAVRELNVTQPAYLTALLHELQTRPVPVWRSYLRWALLHAAASCLSTPFVETNSAFYDRELAGIAATPERWQRVVERIDRTVGDALGQIYVAAFFPPESRARVLAIAENVRDALRTRLQTREWMDAATRAHALAKLDAMKIRIGYPDTWRDYSGLTVDRGPFVLNVFRALAFDARRNLARLGRPVVDEWKLTAPEIRATNNIIANEILFPAGFLQPPLFDPAADDALNYGGIGAVIGHEITHGFDDQGRRFDEHGNLADWWTPPSEQRFKERAAAIIRQFNAYTVLDGVHLNGERSQGENIADLGGVKLAFAALQKILAGRPRPLLDGFTPEQRFFLSWATIRRGKMTPEAQRLRVTTDPHSPPEFRCNAPLSNLDEFAAAFQVPPGARMRRADADRVEIW